MVATSDGGFAIGAYGITKTDSAGNVLWSQTYPVGPGFDDQWIEVTIVEPFTGGFALAGTASYGGDGVLIRTDADGTLLWSQIYDNGWSEIDGAVATADGGYALTGCSNNVWLIKQSVDYPSIDVNVMVDYGDGSYVYTPVTLNPLTTGTSAFNATVAAAGSVGYSEESWGAFVYEINGVVASGNQWWALYQWDSAEEEWEMASTGASGLMLSDGDIIGWVLDPDWSVSPPYLPTDPRVASDSATFSISTPTPSLPVGTTFTVTVDISDAVDAKQLVVNNLHWDPAVLDCIDVAAGSFISSPLQTFAPVDHVGGNIATMVLTSMSGTGSSGSGVFATLTFNVTGYGSSNIIVEEGITKDTSDVFARTLNLAATYVGQSEPTPSGPTAVISSPTNNLYAVIGTSVSCDGTQSLNGWTGTTVDYIYWYNWTVVTPSSVVIENPGDGSYYPYSLALSEIGDYVVILTVQTDPLGLNQTDSKTVVVHVIAAPDGPVLDVYTNHGGFYNMTNATAYGPQELIVVYANVTYNGAPVVNKDVVFEIRDANGDLVAILYGRSDVNGVATAQYRLPWPDTANPEDTFGVWSVSATVDISQTVNFDRVCFVFDYILEISDLSVSPSSVVRGDAVDVTLTVRNVDTLAHDCLATVTLLDEAHVPVGVVTISGSVVAGAGALAGEYPSVAGVESFVYTFTVPTYAFVGLASAHGNVLTGLPSVGGVAYCPEVTTSFSITI
jgi:hypothetical protein